MPDLQRIGNQALQKAPQPLRRALDGIPLQFRQESGPTSPMAGGLGPGNSGMIAGVENGNPNTVSVMQPDVFEKNADQLATHEALHNVQNNWAPAIQKAIPPDNPNDPYNYGGTAGVKSLLAKGGTIANMPREQGAAALQYGQSQGMPEPYASLAKTIDDVPRSQIEMTDPMAKTLNMRPRTPQVPPSNVPGMEDLSGPPVPYAKMGPYRTDLGAQEPAFESWVKQNHVPFDNSPHSDYDMRGYYKAMTSGDQNAKQQKSGFDGRMHFPDTYKTPYHKTFSNESEYATPDAPHWQGDRLMSNQGKLLADETPKKKMNFAKEIYQPGQPAPGDTSLLPPDMVPTAQPAPAPTPAPDALQQNIARDQQQLQKVNFAQKNPWGTANNHPGTMGKIAHVLSVAGNIAGNIVAPNVMANIPGTELHNQAESNGLTHRLNEETEEQSQNQSRNASTQATQLANAAEPQKAADTHALSGATQANVESETYARTHPLPEYEYQQTDHGLLAINKKTGQAQPVTLNGTPVGPKVQTKIAPLEVGGKEHSVLVNESTGESIKDLGATGQKPPTVNVNQGTWAIDEDPTGKPVLFNSKTGEMRDAPPGLQKSGTFAKNTKPSADEQRRADLAENLNENLSTLRDIVGRRPELFGPMAGRWAELKQKFGSDDPDLGTLQTIEHQIGMAQISAHGMRSAQGIQGAGDSILNHLHSGPHALTAAIDAAQNSVKTFTSDVENKGRPAAGGPVAGAVENGYRFKGGNPSDQKNWEKVQ